MKSPFAVLGFVLKVKADDFTVFLLVCRHRVGEELNFTRFGICHACMTEQRH